MQPQVGLQSRQNQLNRFHKLPCRRTKGRLTRKRQKSDPRLLKYKIQQTLKYSSLLSNPEYSYHLCFKMATTMKEVVQMYQTLSQEWSRKPPNLQKCGEQLSKLKVCLLELSFLPTADIKPSKQELLVARDILEIGAQWSIMTKDIPGFERYMAQLKCYYLDYKTELPESAYKYQLLGLNLLCLLSQTRLAEFHTELELLPSKEIYNNIYIKHPVSMEQYLMEGSYNKVFLAKGNVPAESYSFFIDILLNTIRDEIAACAEKAYDRISSTEAARILFFENKKDVKEYAAKRGWTLRPDHFFEFNKEPEKKEETIPANELASQAIEYARELEMIV
ncbi:26S proteasome non-ATPase regulatory subunit 8-like isoform X4 [Branchiostoma floridae x Branchiostoma belcheri]